MVAEWTLSLRRSLPVRWVWAVAILTAVALPIVRGSMAAPQSSASRLPSVPASATRETSLQRGTGTATPFPAMAKREWPDLATVRATMARRIALPVVSPAVTRVIATAWVITSLVLLCAAVWTIHRLRLDRKRWKPLVLHGTAVLVTDGFGPALVGLVRPEIVVPQWLLTLDATAASTILAHESEHRRAGDAHLIAGAILLTILVPWNAPLWWMAHRLMRAVELDCDARVIAGGVERTRYASLLLDAWSHASEDRRLTFSAAFAERGSKLGQRVHHMLRPEPRRPMMKCVSGAVTVAVLAVFASAIPSPQFAQRAVAGSPPSAQPQGPLPLVVIDGTPRPELNSLAVIGVELRSRTGEAALVRIQMVDSVHAVRLYGARGKHGATAAWSRGWLDRGGATLPDSIAMQGAVEPAMPASATPPDVAGAVTSRLVSGLPISEAQRNDIATIVRTSLEAARALRGPGRVRQAGTIAIANSRDSAIRLLLRTEAARVQFDRNAVAQMRVRTVPSLHETADTEIRWNYFMNVPASDGEIRAAVRILEGSLAEEEVMYRRAPDDGAAQSVLIDRRLASIRAVLDSDPKRTAFDRAVPSIRKSIVRW